MFGYLRLFLSFLVLLSHLNIRLYTLNIGVIAVVIFYILAGFVVSYIYSTIYNRNYRLFIIDRVKRIFPLYYFIIFLTLIFITITNFGNPHFSFFNIFTNLTIIPLNFYMLWDNTILSDPKWWLIPPAWSLGTELQAYLLLPFAIIYPRVKYIFIIFSFLIYIVANFSLINPDYFGYRFIVGVLFIFLLGTSIQKISSKTQTKFDKFFLFSTWFLTFFLIFLSIFIDRASVTYTKETALGLLIGIPLVYLLSLSQKKLLFNRFFGSLSYGLFLAHFLIIWIIEYLNLTKLNSKIEIFLVIFLSLSVATVGVFVEKIVNSLFNYLKKTKKSVEKM